MLDFVLNIDLRKIIVVDRASPPTCIEEKTTTVYWEINS